MPPKKASRKNKTTRRNRFGFGYQQPAIYYKLIVTYNPGSLNEYRADYVPMNFPSPEYAKDTGDLCKWDPLIDTAPGYRVVLVKYKAPNGKTYMGFNDRRNGLMARAGALKLNLHSLKLLHVDPNDDWGYAFSEEIEDGNTEHPMAQGLRNEMMRVLKIETNPNGSVDGTFMEDLDYEEQTGKKFTFGKSRERFRKDRSVKADIKYLSGR